ncbi:hypothetical protein TH66_03195 [Carbonactinospora thermoautotrophica]|uniref:Uncharacterized protein n=1 Tax=Carbonactinospora thermoautotrophica TaxID=1469144 RepID=A0A132N5K7_9ACTN|nr:hypothetical protein [Carbonactinospora thermoautotrophica]KWX00772.1 hypothetical protein LI90_1795 [Carbonactinospora thermoautotrophica]KWX05270.1 hypothetical protein TH66_03195 [Carbonactinospora thermoautotrophica]KWX08574.1 hypothetical protein TR74_14410 [Carbonactinospora thermoautotrophica]
MTTELRAVVDSACATCHGAGTVNGNPCLSCSLLLTPEEIAFLYGEEVPVRRWSREAEVTLILLLGLALLALPALLYELGWLPR